MDPPWDQVYERDVPPDFDEMRKREDRKERIKPYWDLLVVDKEPKVNKDILIRLMHDLKEEGNALFKEEHYDIAWMHYRNAIFVVRSLENRYYHQVEKEFISSLFSNRAFCCLKKNMYQEAVQDCESAIQVHPKNIKAYYRQALAYKHLKRYVEAYKTANKGDEIQPSSVL